jgi:hypothetical protein
MAAEIKETLYELRLSISGFGRGISESHHLWTNDLADAIEHGKYICRWRAAILCLGAKLNYASIVTAKGKPDSRICVSQPIAGHTGVYVEDSIAANLRLNTMGAGLMVRFETESGTWVNRLIRGMPDWVINAQDYNFYAASGNVLDTAKTPLIVDPALYPKDALYPYSETAKSPLATGTGTGNPLNLGYVNYPDALRSYFQAVYQLTCWAKYGPYRNDGGTPPVQLPGWLKYTWNEIAIRYVGDRRAGRPSGR